MPFFILDLQTSSGIEPALAPLEFSGLEEAYCDVCAAIPNVAADLLRAGTDPMRCAYLVRDENGVLLLEISFTELVRPLRSSVPISPISPLLRQDEWLLAWALASRKAAEAARERSETALMKGREIRKRARETLNASPLTEPLVPQQLFSEPDWLDRAAN